MAEQPQARPGGPLVRPPSPPNSQSEMRGDHGSAPSHAGAKVTVACKLPHGLLLRVFDFKTEPQAVMGGGTRDVEIAYPREEMVRIRGNAVPFGVVPKHQIEEGFALTHGVDKDFFDLWMHQNRLHRAVQSGLIYAFEKTEDVLTEARKRASLRSGLEPLDPQKLPRGIEAGNRRDE